MRSGARAVLVLSVTDELLAKSARSEKKGLCAFMTMYSSTNWGNVVPSVF